MQRLDADGDGEQVSLANDEVLGEGGRAGVGSPETAGCGRRCQRPGS